MNPSPDEALFALALEQPAAERQAWLDRDNMNRFLVDTYINEANAILPTICASPRVGKAAAQLANVDAPSAPHGQFTAFNRRITIETSMRA